MPKKTSNTNSKLVNPAIIAMLTALYVVLNRFASVSAWNINIGFSFIATVAGAGLLGMGGGMLVGGLGDFIGAILFPKGAYFPGFTLCAALVGLIYGAMIRKKQTVLFTTTAAILSQTVTSLLLNSLWITILYGAEYKATLISRLPQYFLMTAVQIVISPMILKVCQKLKKEIQK